MSPAVPLLGLFDIDQPEIGLMDQGGRLQGLAGLLLGQLLSGESAKFIVDQG